ncbi:hypothetical protein GCM10009836_28220 [Pseudonocardia ailaonensis]|uniref:Asp23/Gls24 family envelope stress response protein n=1 Tax=Pseudonocardia ailaonensis TaxID=367279 RepID=A0ABN2N0U2_9PSEU
MSTPAGSTPPPTPPVRLHVADVVVARIAAAAARAVPGVAALRPDLGQALLGLAGSLLGEQGGPLSAAGAAATVDGDVARISLTLVTTLGHNCRDLAAAVQRAVGAQIRTETGLGAVVTVTVADVALSPG